GHHRQCEDAFTYLVSGHGLTNLDDLGTELVPEHEWLIRIEEEVGSSKSAERVQELVGMRPGREVGAADSRCEWSDAQLSRSELERSKRADAEGAFGQESGTRSVAAGFSVRVHKLSMCSSARSR